MELIYWHWWAFALLLLALEVFVSGFVLLWFGVGAAVVGVLLFVYPALDWKAQLTVFAVIATTATVFSQRYLRNRPIATSDPNLNLRGREFIGQCYTLEMAIENGTGRMRAGGSTWRVKGEDLPMGARVRVTGIDGASLIVEPAETAASH